MNVTTLPNFLPLLGLSFLFSTFIIQNRKLSKKYASMIYKTTFIWAFIEFLKFSVYKLIFVSGMIMCKSKSIFDLLCMFISTFSNLEDHGICI